MNPGLTSNLYTLFGCLLVIVVSEIWLGHVEGA